jgi:hypothetical protein
MPRKTIDPDEIERQRQAPEDDPAEDELVNDELERSADEDAPESVPAHQLGGSRGSSGQGGPESGGEPEKDAVVGGALPPGTTPEDYIGGRKPHATRRGRTRGASGARNKVL